MLVYLDEAYKSNKTLFLGALFLPSKAPRIKLHRDFLELKKELDYVDSKGLSKEIKYNFVRNKAKLNLSTKAIKLFARTEDAFFRVCCIDYDEKKLNNHQKATPKKIREAIRYTKATILLMKNNLKTTKNGVLLMDDLTRARGDRFDQLIQYRLGEGPNKKFNYIGYVDSKQESNHTIQIADLLLGSVLNEHHPTQNPHKNSLCEYVKKELKIPILKGNYWKNKTQAKAEDLHPKFTVRYWKNPYGP